MPALKVCNTLLPACNTRSSTTIKLALFISVFLISFYLPFLSSNESIQPRSAYGGCFSYPGSGPSDTLLIFQHKMRLGVIRCPEDSCLKISCGAILCFIISVHSIVQQSMRHGRVKDPLKETVPFSGTKVYDDHKIYLFFIVF